MVIQTTLQLFALVALLLVLKFEVFVFLGQLLQLDLILLLFFVVFVVNTGFWLLFQEVHLHCEVSILLFYSRRWKSKVTSAISLSKPKFLRCFLGQLSVFHIKWVILAKFAARSLLWEGIVNKLG